ncbi:hypothetical protein GIB67_021797 [Kingdonia uniflora]|uniref:Spindle and kinetochore-associated protein 1 homolog n=1 Tax=Kingdonia uniflora TaxID=39325 RepID=A0A7J7P2P1_9MAGN|nr:hypothetical protein GIB67_021797 [Kingdonia uniflora]
MDLKQAGSSLDTLISSFNTRISELQELVIGRNMYPATCITDLSAIDTSVTAMELQMQSIKDRLREETEAIPKAKKLVHLSLRQQKKLEHMFAQMPALLPKPHNAYPNNCLVQESNNHNVMSGSLKFEEEHVAPPKEKKGRSSAPLWYMSAEEFDSLSSYMRGRLTVDKVNAAINDMAAYADTNAQLIADPKKKWYLQGLSMFTKLSENAWEKAHELRVIAMKESVKGKHFFLEADMKGPMLKLDNTGKAILTVSVC